MMKILICPGERPGVAFLTQAAPLVNVPLLGESLVGHWLASLAGSGEQEVLVLATDRPEQVRDVVEDGARWGLKVEVMAELQEPSAAGACRKYGGGAGGSDPASIAIVMDHLPGLPEMPLFTSYACWFACLQAWLACPARPGRIGARELKPGVWVGLRTRVAASAELRAPCWLGENVRVGPDAIIGPRAVLEDRVIVEAASEVLGSVVEPDTFVGTLTKIQDSVAWGSTLISWRTGSCTQVPDPFLMGPLGPRSWFNRSRSPEKWLSGFWPVLTRPWQLLLTSRAKCRER